MGGRKRERDRRMTARERERERVVGEQREGWMDARSQGFISLQTLAQQDVEAQTRTQRTCVSVCVNTVQPDHRDYFIQC